MDLNGVMVILFACYLGYGLFAGYHFFTKELPEAFDEELDEQEDHELIKARDDLYDAFHNLDKIVGRKGIIIIIFIGSMLFWLPYWLIVRLKAKRVNGGED